MKPTTLRTLAVAAAAGALWTSMTAAQPPRTFRLDLVHAGGMGQEIVALERAVLEPLPWPGNPDRPVDPTGWGKYLFEVRDLATQRLLYSRGYASIYGEWETTEEAATSRRAFGESLRFPAPAAPVQVVLKRRDPRTQGFTEIWTQVVDPGHALVDRAAPLSAGPRIALHEAGDPARKLDLLVLGDGYTAAERGKFEADARRLVAALLAVEPFASRKSDLNVWGLCPAALESGISRPSTGVHRRSPIGATYDAFGSERYVLTFDNRALREVASQAPYDALVILANGKTYGGGGIFNLYSTAAADSLWAPYLFVHELGHHLAGLADEYFTSETAYAPAGAERPEPWEANATALADPAALKWRDLVAPGTPLPTPWDLDGWVAWQKQVQAERRRVRAERRPESEMDALFLKEKAEATRFLRAQPQWGKVGAFEGANYEARGYYRPELDCIMFTRNDVPFCRVCRRALETVLDLYSEP
jgi:hypothetical protein